MKINEIVYMKNVSASDSQSFQDSGNFWQDVHDSHDWNWRQPLKLENFLLEVLENDYSHGNYVIFGYPKSSEMSDNDFPYEAEVAFFIEIKPFADGVYVSNVRVEPKFRNKGIAIKLYLLISNWLKKPIYSGNLQSIHSKNNIWEKLIKRYPDKVVGYDPVKKIDLPLSMLQYGPAVYKTQAVYNKQKSDSIYAEYARSMNTKRLKLIH